DRHVMGVREPQRGVDDLRVGAQSSWIFSPQAPASSTRSTWPGTSVRALACRPRLTGRNSNARRVLSMAYGGSSNPAGISVGMPADRAPGTSLGVIRCTWLSIPPAVAISPYPLTGQVLGPIVSSTPVVVSGFPARPIRRPDPP